MVWSFDRKECRGFQAAEIRGMRFCQKLMISIRTALRDSNILLSRLSNITLRGPWNPEFFFANLLITKDSKICHQARCMIYSTRSKLDCPRLNTLFWWFHIALSHAICLHEQLSQTQCTRYIWELVSRVPIPPCDGLLDTESSVWPIQDRSLNVWMLVGHY